MSAMASQITGVLIIQAQIKETINAPRLLAFVGGIQRSPVDSPHKGPVTRKMFPFDDVIMTKITTMKKMQLLAIRLATHMDINTENDFIGFQHTACYTHLKTWVKYTPGLTHFESYF